MRGFNETRRIEMERITVRLAFLVLAMIANADLSCGQPGVLS